MKHCKSNMASAAGGLALLLLLSACGQKGPLYLATRPVPPASAATSGAAVVTPTGASTNLPLPVATNPGAPPPLTTPSERILK
ncbi:MAG TPA: lipoprotein [Burkholderiaceae bacterium]